VTPDLLGRGWVPEFSDGQRAGLTLALGVALVLTPLWAGTVTAALFPAETYEYRSVTLSPAGDGFDTQPDAPAIYDQEIDGVACEDIDPPYACGVEWGLRDGPVTVPDETMAAPQEPYVYLDRFYRRTDTQPGNGRTVLSIERVDAATVLADIAVPKGDLPDRVVAVIDAETTITRRSRLRYAGTVVETTAGYALVAEWEQHHRNLLPPRELALPLMLVAGFALLRDGQRHWDRWRRERQG
jgi:hypothetical protein